MGTITVVSSRKWNRKKIGSLFIYWKWYTQPPRLVYNIEKLNAFVYCEVFRSSSISFQPILYFVKILPSLCYYVECTILQQLLVVFIYSSPSPPSFEMVQSVALIFTWEIEVAKNITLHIKIHKQIWFNLRNWLLKIYILNEKHDYTRDKEFVLKYSQEIKMI